MAAPPAHPERAWVAGAVVAAGVIAALSGTFLTVLGYPARTSAAHGWISDLDAVGRFARSLHHWAADAALAAALVWLIAAWMRNARGSVGVRRFRAIAAAVVLLCVAYLTGRILPWDQHAWESYDHVAAGAAPAESVLRSEEGPDAARLGLIWAAHLLAAVALVVPAFVYLDRRAHGPTQGPRDRAAAVIAALSRASMVATASAVVFVAALLTPALGPRPIEDLQVARPDWPFLWLSPIERVLGPVAAPLAVALAIALLWWAPRAAPTRSAVWRSTVAVAVLLVWALASALGLAA